MRADDCAMEGGDSGQGIRGLRRGRRTDGHLALYGRTTVGRRASVRLCFTTGKLPLRRVDTKPQTRARARDRALSRSATAQKSSQVKSSLAIVQCTVEGEGWKVGRLDGCSQPARPRHMTAKLRLELFLALAPRPACCVPLLSPPLPPCLPSKPNCSIAQRYSTLPYLALRPAASQFRQHLRHDSTTSFPLDPPSLSPPLALPPIASATQPRPLCPFSSCSVLRSQVAYTTGQQQQQQQQQQQHHH
nr:hypothetical protein CFP56_11621 [Quercus suber]